MHRETHSQVFRASCVHIVLLSSTNPHQPNQAASVRITHTCIVGVCVVCRVASCLIILTDGATCLSIYNHQSVVTLAEIFVDHVDRVRLYSLSLLDRLSHAEPFQQFTRALSAAFEEFCAAVITMDANIPLTSAVLQSDQTTAQRQRTPGLMSSGSGSGGKKSWSELKSVVSDLRRSLSGLSSMVPMNVHFRTLSDGRTRIYFLSTPPNGWETTLLYADIAPYTLNDEDGETELLRPPMYVYICVLFIFS